jgi:hypothetical protein
MYLTCTYEIGVDTALKCHGVYIMRNSSVANVASDLPIVWRTTPSPRTIISSARLHITVCSQYQERSHIDLAYHISYWMLCMKV